MTVKGDISAGYLTELRQKHGHKKLPVGLHVLLTGDSKPGSIGEYIRLALTKHQAHVESSNIDVRHYIRLPPEKYNTLIMAHGAMHLDWLEVAPMEALENVVNVNLTGTIRLVQAFVRSTLDNPTRKTIIGIGSMAHKAILNGSAAYCASKAGMVKFLQCAAWELAPKGYDVYIINPSNTAGTPMTEQTVRGLMRYRDMTREQAEEYWNDSPLREQILQPQEISDLVLFLLSGRAPYLSGACLDLGGGQR